MTKELTLKEANEKTEGFIEFTEEVEHYLKLHLIDHGVNLSAISSHQEALSITKDPHLANIWTLYSRASWYLKKFGPTPLEGYYSRLQQAEARIKELEGVNK